jgi:hypothetical protein
VDQAGVPGAVAVLVVYGLEPVEVEQRQRGRPSPALGPGDIFGEAPFGGPAVVGAREVVRGGQLPEGPHRRVQPLDGVLDVGHEPPGPVRVARGQLGDLAAVEVAAKGSEASVTGAWSACIAHSVAAVPPSVAGTVTERMRSEAPTPKRRKRTR